jgi:hypothetical protein
MIKRLTYENVVPIIESLKELGRVAVIAMIPILIDGVSQNRIDWRIVAGAGMIAVLRALDKLAHLETKGGETGIVSKLKLPF